MPIRTKPGDSAQEPPTSKPDRSIQFWLALAGIAATAIVGVVGSVLTYKTSADRIHFDAQARVIDQRKTAYLDFLNAEADEWDQGGRLTERFAQLAAGQISYGVLVDQWNKWSATLNPQYRAMSEVKLVASQNIWLLVDSWTRFDDQVRRLMPEVKNAVDVVCADRPSTTCAEVPSVTDEVFELARATKIDSSPAIKTFDEVAQPDLGLSSKVCRPTQDPSKAAEPWLVAWSCT